MTTTTAAVRDMLEEAIEVNRVHGHETTAEDLTVLLDEVQDDAGCAALVRDVIDCDAEAGRQTTVDELMSILDDAADSEGGHP